VDYNALIHYLSSSGLTRGSREVFEKLDSGLARNAWTSHWTCDGGQVKSGM